MHSPNFQFNASFQVPIFVLCVFCGFCFSFVLFCFLLLLFVADCCCVLLWPDVRSPSEKGRSLLADPTGNSLKQSTERVPSPAPAPAPAPAPTANPNANANPSAPAGGMSASKLQSLDMNQVSKHRKTTVNMWRRMQMQMSVQINTSFHSFLCVCWPSSTQVHDWLCSLNLRAVADKFRADDVDGVRKYPMSKCSNAQIHKCTNAQMHKCPMHKCTNAHMLKCPTPFANSRPSFLKSRRSRSCRSTALEKPPSWKSCSEFWIRRGAHPSFVLGLKKKTKIKKMVFVVVVVVVGFFYVFLCSSTSTNSSAKVIPIPLQCQCVCSATSDYTRIQSHSRCLCTININVMFFDIHRSTTSCITNFATIAQANPRNQSQCQRSFKWNVAITAARKMSRLPRWMT